MLNCQERVARIELASSGWKPRIIAIIPYPLTDGEGFEPPNRIVSTISCFQDKRLQPLGQPSKIET